jgi:hypothetical protein
MAGVNRALNSVSKNFSLYESAESRNKIRKCVFISHKYEDKVAARRIGKFIMNDLDLDIYLDENDEDLQKAIENEDDKSITLAINKGIEESTHLLCVISDSTKFSWWVPYEIEYAKKHGTDIATLRLKGTPKIPSFLTIENSLNNFRELSDYYKKFTSSYKLLFESADASMLKSILE